MRWIAPLLFFAAAAIAGCSDYAHCHDICATKQECTDNTLDVAKCAQDCSDRAGNDDSYQRQVDQCQTCTNDRSCADDIQCAGDCSGVP